MGISPETGPESATEVSTETTEDSSLPFDFSKAAVVAMKQDYELGRTMWRALLNGEAGMANRNNAIIRLQTLFWDMIDGAIVGDRRTNLMVEELIKEYDPDYKRHMRLEESEGLALELVLGDELGSTYGLFVSSERPPGQ